MKIGIIGGGASGLFAAVHAALTASQSNIAAEITVYEKNAAAGRKLLATGNGRCNFTNEDVTPSFYHGDEKLFEAVYPQFTNDDAVAFFRSIGLEPYTDNAGRVYPLSRRSESVLSLLIFQCGRLGVKFRFDYNVTSVKRERCGFLLNGEDHADRLVIAAGGAAAPQLGTDGSVFALLQTLGVRATDLYPALTAIELMGFPKKLKGVRAFGTVEIVKDGKTLASDTGELQLTEYGVSGIPAMTVSEAAVRNPGATAILTFAPETPFREICDAAVRFRKDYPEASVSLFLTGFLPSKLAEYVASAAGFDPADAIGKMSPQALRDLAGLVKGSRWRVRGVKGFSFAQVTAGGVGSDSVDPQTLCCKTVPGLFLCGEVLNVNGDCGGYNLQWAWSSGYVAGRNCVLN
ncbi:MAG: aminoacetone oxidase family FAD-binding enzyme [Clostridia bacterium]|nr:aminoacetone oxidase family FAD-binding enzyme [Clostridia bacterium]